MAAKYFAVALCALVLLASASAQVVNNNDVVIGAGTANTTAGAAPGSVTNNTIATSPSPTIATSPSPTIATLPSPTITSNDEVTNTTRPPQSGFSCYVNAGMQPSGALGVMPQLANNTGVTTYCYSAQVPNGTCSDANCTNAVFQWDYGVRDKQGCDSAKQQESTGIYRNVLCCSTAQCNAPDATVDATTVKLVNPDVPTIEQVKNTTTTNVTATNGPTTGGTGGVTSPTGSTTNRTSAATSGAFMAGPAAFVTLCVAALVALF